MSTPTLVCPACRYRKGNDLHVRTLDPCVEGLSCACGAVYPVIDGIPLLFRNMDGWLAGEGAEALRRHDLPEPLAARVVRGAGGALARNAALVSVYGASRHGPLQDWLRAAVEAATGPVLELGCGMGATERRDVVGLDHNLALLRRHNGTRICADATDPPFLPSIFSTVAVANLLDSCADPALVLAQADALLAPGGRLIVTCAYAFSDEITEVSRRFSPKDLVDALSGTSPLGGYRFNHRTIEVVDRLPWPIRVSDRTTHVHDTQAIISLKQS